MYIIFKIGNKQYKGSIGEIITLERMKFKIGKKIFIKEILFISNNSKVKIGKPIIKNIQLEIKIIKHYIGKKINIIKFKRRKHYKKTQGHRQLYTLIKILKTTKTTKTTKNN